MDAIGGDKDESKTILVFESEREERIMNIV